MMRWHPLNQNSLPNPFLLPATGDPRRQHLIHLPYRGNAHRDGSSGRSKHHPARHQDCRSQRSAVHPCCKGTFSWPVHEKQRSREAATAIGASTKCDAIWSEALGQQVLVRSDNL